MAWWRDTIRPCYPCWPQRCYIEQPFKWEDDLHHLCMACNWSIQATTGYTPFYLMFGRQARMPIDVVYGTTPLQPFTMCEYAARLQRSLETAYQQIRKQMDFKIDRQKEIYNRRVHGNPFESEELIWLYSQPTRRGQCRKLHQPWSGPYKIIHKLSDVTYLKWYTLTGWTLWLAEAVPA